MNKRSIQRLVSAALLGTCGFAFSACASMGLSGEKADRAVEPAQSDQIQYASVSADNEGGMYFQDVEPSSSVNEQEMGLKIARKGTITVRTFDERSYANDLRRLHEKFGGLVLSFSSNSVSYKLPFNRLEELITYLEDHEDIDVDSFNFSAFDSTGSYYSAEARLETKRAFKARLQELADKAIGVDELLKIEREILRLQDEIDQLESQRRSIELTAGLVDVTIFVR